MKKISYALMPFSLVFVGFILSCNFLTPTEQSEQVEQTPTTNVPVSSPTVTETLLPTEASTPTPIPATPTKAPIPPANLPTLEPSPTPGMAPFCDDGVVNQSSCEYPFAQQSSTFCVNKSPYNLIAVSDRATYQLLHDYVKCEEAGVTDGQRHVICTGPMAYYFELRVCDSACTSLQVETDYDRCPYGYVYNNLQGCCTNTIQEVEQGCTVLKLRTISCQIDCGQFKTYSACNGYGYACRWDSATSTCRLKK